MIDGPSKREAWPISRRQNSVQNSSRFLRRSRHFCALSQVRQSLSRLGRSMTTWGQFTGGRPAPTRKSGALLQAKKAVTTRLQQPAKTHFIWWLDTFRLPSSFQGRKRAAERGGKIYSDPLRCIKSYEKKPPRAALILTSPSSWRITLDYMVALLMVQHPPCHLCTATTTSLV